MNYKNLVLMMLLLPITSFGSSNEARIKELEEAQFTIEKEIADLNMDIDERYKKYFEYKNFALTFWKSSNEKDSEILFDECIKELGNAFYNSEDLSSIIAKSSFEEKDGYDLYGITSRVVLQKRFLAKCTERLYKLIEQLITINKQLNNLKN